MAQVLAQEPAQQPSVASVQAAMMEELGCHRQDQLPMDDRPKNHPHANSGRGAGFHAALNQIARTAPVQSAWRAAIEQGQFQDDDAQVVEGLDTLGGGRLHDRRNQFQLSSRVSSRLAAQHATMGHSNANVQSRNGRQRGNGRQQAQTRAQRSSMPNQGPRRRPPTPLMTRGMAHDGDELVDMSPVNNTVRVSMSRGAAASPRVSRAGIRLQPASSLAGNGLLENQPPSGSTTDPAEELSNIVFRADIRIVKHRDSRPSGTVFLCGQQPDISFCYIYQGAQPYLKIAVVAIFDYSASSKELSIFYRSSGLPQLTCLLEFDSQRTLKEYVDTMKLLQEPPASKTMVEQGNSTAEAIIEPRIPSSQNQPAAPSGEISAAPPEETSTDPTPETSGLDTLPTDAGEPVSTSIAASAPATNEVVEMEESDPLDDDPTLPTTGGTANTANVGREPSLSLASGASPVGGASSEGHAAEAFGGEAIPSRLSIEIPESFNGERPTLVNLEDDDMPRVVLPQAPSSAYTQDLESLNGSLASSLVISPVDTASPDTAPGEILEPQNPHVSPGYDVLMALRKKLREKVKIFSRLLMKKDKHVPEETLVEIAKTTVAEQYMMSNNEEYDNLTDEDKQEAIEVIVTLIDSLRRTYSRAQLFDIRPDAVCPPDTLSRMHLVRRPPVRPPPISVGPATSTRDQDNIEYVDRSETSRTPVSGWGSKGWSSSDDTPSTEQPAAEVPNNRMPTGEDRLCDSRYELRSVPTERSSSTEHEVGELVDVSTTPDASVNSHPGGRGLGQSRWADPNVEIRHGHAFTGVTTYMAGSLHGTPRSQ
ncbi:uncharacterized protein E0L32_007127 [Thyridium curvatum]|uniref:Uncharacterized protein n=1 Tax=Thyridium curvatum TaxID=1093900 RepID=A0A507B5B0_9PEZI|nr:uncharacterized protein E0L32_007127 [Thyridium curvatum]TPX12241.1 hypothetical protein E0L32_007127 [Thyridium curvatum]